MKSHYFLFIFLFLSIFSCQEEIPTLHIIKEDAITRDDKTDCIVSYIFEKTDITIDAAVKYRGGMSLVYPKMSLGLEINEKFALAGLPEDDDWILNASYVDKTFMRHKVSYDLYRQMGENNLSSLSAYINLKINNEKQGLYILMQEINAAMLGINKEDSMAMLFKDPVVFIDSMPSITQEPDNYFQQKFPKIYNRDQSDFIIQFREFILNSPDSLFSADIDQWIDIDNFIDWQLIIWLSNNGDGILKNFYLYKLDAQTPFRIAIWDYDHSFGRDSDNEYNMMDNPANIYRNILLKRLMTLSTYQLQLQNRWWELRKLTIFSTENIFQMLDENQQKIEISIEDNFEIWGTEHMYFDGNNHEEEIAIFKEFTALRIEQLDEYFSLDN